MKDVQFLKATGKNKLIEICWKLAILPVIKLEDLNQESLQNNDDITYFEC